MFFVFLQHLPFKKEVRVFFLIDPSGVRRGPQMTSPVTFGWFGPNSEPDGS